MNPATKLLSQRSFFQFCKLYNSDLQFIAFHKEIADRLQELFEGKIKKLMIFVPPQFGKSTLASRLFPAWCLGKNSDLRIIHASYGSSLVEGFSRDIQRIINSELYHEIFPETKIGGSGHSKTVEKWEINGKKGKYLCAGVGGGITGQSCDISIVDDVLRGAADAASLTIRNKIWNWYLQELRTRLHNDSKQIFIMTRWHHDDPAGRILELEKDWIVIKYPALNEKNESLFPQLHNSAKLLEMKALSPRTFEALYQQNPTPLGGDMLKREWFKVVQKAEVNLNGKITIFVDGAYTDKTKNDPTGITIFTFHDKKLTVLFHADKYLKMPELLRYIKELLKTYKISNYKILIEPKASGITITQLLQKSGFIAVNLTGRMLRLSKTERVEVCSPTFEAGRVQVLAGTWNKAWFEQIESFPNGTHDEVIDNLCYSANYHFKIVNSGNGAKINN